MFDIVKKKNIFLGISIVLMLVSIASLIFRGFNLDTDFAGGMAVTYQIDKEFSVADVQAAVDSALGATQSPSSVQQSGNEVIIKFGFDNSLQTDEERSDFSMTKIAAITAALQEKFGTPAENTEAPAAEAPAESAAPEAAASAAPTPARPRMPAQSLRLLLRLNRRLRLLSPA